MFLNTVPIEQHESAKYVHDFPRANRDGVMQTWDDVKRQLGRAGGQGFTYVDVLSDFHLLLFLTAFLDMVSVRGGGRGGEEWRRYIRAEARGRGKGKETDESKTLRERIVFSPCWGKLLRRSEVSAVVLVLRAIFCPNRNGQKAKRRYLLLICEAASVLYVCRAVVSAPAR